MLPSYLSPDAQVREGQAVAVDIGGTNLKIALVRLVHGRAELSGPEVSLVPGLSEELSKDAFYSELAKRILPFEGQADRIGICFSHAAELRPDLDGRLISFSKEIRVTGAEGTLIARELSDKLTELGGREKKTYAIINDSAAVLMSGAEQPRDNTSGALIGLVLGTGLNLSYIEKSAEIEKADPAYKAAHMIVNTETGNFSAMPFGVMDTAFDAGTSDPGSHRLEKLSSGRYLGPLILFTLKKAADEGLLSGPSSSYVDKLTELTTPEAGAFLAGRRGESRLDALVVDEGDQAVASVVIDRLFERAAMLTALTVSAVMEKTGAGIEASRPARIIAEGSTINRLHSFRDRFESRLRTLAGARGRYFQVVTIEDATLKGAALAALTRG
jgi:hexokinase